MKKNGIEFKLQEQKFHQGACCAICGQKIQQGDMEYLSECTPYIHLCRMCAISNVSIPPKKGMSIKINNRIYMWVSKGIRGNHICALTNQQIKNGTPCWWSSTKDDPEHKNDSYILTLDGIDNPNEWKPNEKTPLCYFENELVEKEGKIYIEEKTNFSKNISDVKKVVDVENQWWDDNYKPVTQKHLEEDIESFFKQVYGDEYLKDDNVRIFSQNSDKPYINICDYVNQIIPNEDLKKYFVFWQDKNISNNATIKITNRDKIFQQVKTIGTDNALKPISEIKIELPMFICEKYEKINNKWLRRD